MFVNLKIIWLFLFVLIGGLNACKSPVSKDQSTAFTKEEIITQPELAAPLKVGAEHIEKYLPLLEQKTIALVVNPTSMIGATHLVDTLLKLNVNIKMIFAPEHGFRGTADAGELIKDGKDAQTGIPLISLYGKNKKPSKEHLKGLDWILFDIQDVGARFYTYISSMHYIMEACAENGISFMVLDRPNPNGHYVDGPVLDPAFKSFVGMHPIPIVHGMTVGEYAKMINGEQWLTDGIQCNLKVIQCSGYDHSTAYELPVKPSPNLPNIRSIYLYPSLCLFEGTVASVGRGTNTQFQVYGHPDFPSGDYQFTPKPMEGAKSPKHKGDTCKGFSLANMDTNQLFNKAKFDLSFLHQFYHDFPYQDHFFLRNNFIDKLAGSDQLRKQLIAGKSIGEIRLSWEADLNKFKKIRSKYLLYEDFK